MKITKLCWDAFPLGIALQDGHSWNKQIVTSRWVVRTLLWEARTYFRNAPLLQLDCPTQNGLMGGHFVVVKPKVVSFKGLCEAKPTMGLILVKPMAKGFIVHKASLIFFPHSVSFGKKCKNNGGSFQKMKCLPIANKPWVSIRPLTHIN